MRYGVYRRTDVEPMFAEVPASTDEARQAVSAQNQRPPDRNADPLTRRGVLVAEGATYLADGDAAPNDALARRPHVRTGKSLLGFMQRPAAPVPRPRLHLIHLRGGVAPNVKLRTMVVPTLTNKSSEYRTSSRQSQLAHTVTRCASAGPRYGRSFVLLAEATQSSGYARR